jgi:hypothetical protein
MALLDDRDVRIIVPRIRRALEPGVAVASAASGYTDDMLKDVAADAVAELILIGGPSFPFTLSVSSADASGFAQEYLMDPAPDLSTQSLVAAQAAIGQVWNQLSTLRISEKISNESGSWEYQKSATILRDKIKALFSLRDEALAQMKLANVVPALDTFTSLLRTRSPTIDADVDQFDGG